MSRLQSYLNEDKAFWEGVIRILKKECKPYIGVLKLFSNTSILYRGSKHKTQVFIKITPRKDRNPMNTDPKMQKILDDVFEKYFGWRPRSTGVFATSYEPDARAYGYPFLFFPVGKFEVLSSPSHRRLVYRFEQNCIQAKDFQCI